VKPIPTPAYSSSLFCVVLPSASALASAGLYNLQLGRSICTSFHSGSLHERWSTLQGTELDMNAVFFDIILTPSKAGIVQISPQKELSHHIRRIDGM
jgi:hypothetical protein